MTEITQVVLSTVVGGLVSGAMVTLAAVPIMKYRINELETRIKDHETKSERDAQALQTSHREEMNLVRNEISSLSAQLTNITTHQIAELRKIYELTASTFTNLIKELISSNNTTKDSVKESLERVHDRIDGVGRDMSEKFEEVQKEFVSHRFLDAALKKN
jgi:hypothetical protein